MRLSASIPSDSLDCATAQEQISLFIDSMMSAEENAQLESHIDQCGVCFEELQAMRAVRNLMTSSPRIPAPENLALEARIRLSRARHSDTRLRLAFLFSDFVKPMAIRAVLSASVTAVLFGVLLIGLISNQAIVANAATMGPLVQVHQQVRPTELAKLWLAGTEKDGPPEPLLIEAYVDDEGRAYDYRIIDGSSTPEVNRWVWERLYYAQFVPATSFGVPISSSIILSFVTVKS